MGLGKTLELITLLLHDRSAQNGASQPGSTLVICPMSIVGNWHRELQRFAPSLSVMVHHGAGLLADAALREDARKHGIVITTYALALRDTDHLVPLECERVVLTEPRRIK